MRSLTVVHRSATEVEEGLCRQLQTTQTAMDAAELAVRIGCGAERVRAHLTRLEQRGLVSRRDGPLGPRWGACG